MVPYASASLVDVSAIGLESLVESKPQPSRPRLRAVSIDTAPQKPGSIALRRYTMHGYQPLPTTPLSTNVLNDQTNEIANETSTQAIGAGMEVDVEAYSSNSNDTAMD